MDIDYDLAFPVSRGRLFAPRRLTENASRLSALLEEDVCFPALVDDLSDDGNAAGF